MSAPDAGSDDDPDAHRGVDLGADPGADPEPMVRAVAVSYRYDSGDPALDGVDLRREPLDEFLGHRVDGAPGHGDDRDVVIERVRGAQRRWRVAGV